MNVVTFQENSVTRWFGSKFEQLHPMLQDLHRNGGVLRGTVDIKFGQDIAGWVGKRLAQKLGIPNNHSVYPLEVTISHHNDKLYWSRKFGNESQMLSVFQPIGKWPEGYWIEQTGFIEMQLTVDLIEGGWYWRVLRIRLGRLKLPLWLFPKSKAYKRIENGKYCFYVEFRLPILGTIKGSWSLSSW
ncbi:MAG: DUF4166 domain-containing protein [Pseudomonadota bacterium]